MNKKNNTDLFGNNDLQNEINNDFYIKECYKCLKTLYGIKNEVVNYEFDKIEDCIKTCNEANIKDAEIENNLYRCKIIFDHNLNDLFTNAYIANNTLQYISRFIETKFIPSYSQLLRKQFELLKECKKEQNSRINPSFSEYVIKFEQTVNDIYNYIKKYETIDSILQEDITSQKDKVFYTRYREVLINVIITGSEKCNHLVKIIDMYCRNTQQIKTNVEEIYSFFKKLNNKYNIYVNLYNDLKPKIKQYSDFIKQYKEKLYEFARALDSLTNRVRANRNILVERLYPIIKSIFNIFLFH